MDLINQKLQEFVDQYLGVHTFSELVQAASHHDGAPVFDVPEEIDEPIMRFGKKTIDFFNPDVQAQAPTQNYPMSRLTDALVIVAAYLVFVLFGLLLKSCSSPEAKKSAEKKSVFKKFYTEPVLILVAMYNIAQVMLCGWMVWETIEIFQQEGYTIICNKYDYGAPKMAAVLYVFYMSKILDFCDTLFIVLRGKWTQFSFLHIYHHASIFLVYWLNLNAGYDGDIYFTIVLNGTIHFIMYGYYFLTAFNIPVPTFIKKMITLSQMFQFLCMNAQAIYILYFGCEFPRNVTIFYLGYIISLFLLFNNFRKKTYSKKDKKSKKE